MAQYEQTHYEEQKENARQDEQLEIIVEPWKKLVIHELLEYKFEDLAKLVATQSVQQGGTAIPTISWAEGVAFLISPFPDESEVIIEEKLKGIIHYNTVLFALKKNFEAEIFMRGHEIRINLIDVGTNDIFKLLARKLVEHAKLIPSNIPNYGTRGTNAPGLQ
ncbi:MAG: hypothetical protein ACYCQJ_06275 [Nitrososphaerales archaeon]